MTGFLRSAMALLIFGLALVAGSPAHAQQYPARPVTLILSFPPGAVVDNVGRRLAASLSEMWKVPVIPENKGGAGGNVAASFLAKSPPDGYTLMLTVYDGLVIAKAAGLSLGFDAMNDLAPVALVGLSTTTFLVNANSPFKTFPDLIAYAKANPGKLNFGSNGVGGSYHLAIEQINAEAGTSIVHVPYKGGAPSMVDLLAERVDAILATTSLANPQLKAGKVRVIALGSAKRSELYPGIPTIAEASVPGFEVPLGLGVFAPAGTPAPLIARLNADIRKALLDPDMKQRLVVDGVEATQLTPEQFKARLTSEVTQLEKLIRRLNLKFE
jgi:tripartite-type tricarboxylate transporter receptor subunit TctC